MERTIKAIRRFALGAGRKTTCESGFGGERFGSAVLDQTDVFRMGSEAWVLDEQKQGKSNARGLSVYIFE